MKHQCGKRAWPTEELAQRALTNIWRRPRPGGRQMELRTYQCPDCGHWHLTSKPQDWIGRPSHAELWRRHQLALSLLDEGAPDVAEKVARVLRGGLIQDGAA